MVKKPSMGREDEMRVSTQYAIALIVLALAVGGGHAWAQTPTVSIETEYLATLEAPLEPPQSVGSRVIVNVPAGGRSGDRKSTALSFHQPGIG
jgi:subtilisin-like proprotein convertase family protein